MTALRFDRFARDLATAATRALAGIRTAGGLVFWKDSAETLIPMEIGILPANSRDYGDCELTRTIRIPATTIPSHVDRADEAGWGDASDLFRLLLARELDHALRAVAPALRCPRYLGDPDGLEPLAPPRQRDEAAIRRALSRRGLDAAGTAALATRCFVDPQRRVWLVALAPAKSRPPSTTWKRTDLYRLERAGKRPTLSFQAKAAAVLVYVDHSYEREIPRAAAEAELETRLRDGWLIEGASAASRLDMLQRIGKAHRMTPTIALDLGRGVVRDATAVFEAWIAGPAEHRAFADRLAAGAGSYDQLGCWLDQAHGELHEYGPTGIPDPESDAIKLAGSAKAQLAAFTAEVVARGAKLTLGARVAGRRRPFAGTGAAKSVLWLVRPR